MDYWCFPIIKQKQKTNKQTKKQENADSIKKRVNITKE